ncbi:seed trypsin/chymotrypsin inhibitor TI5-72-like [Lotus japonicus]|uniref:seed trypsin/chymotrypsin inhibitor TI5-72-like n=1 Tax=Lotus japonicus TaxID=34305 RepID=UPI00258E03EA|nr:seed trypsin/chymotrypsin inhibitor TI5-72-like [Lotus japonicus]
MHKFLEVYNKFLPINEPVVAPQIFTRKKRDINTHQNKETAEPETMEFNKKGLMNVVLLLSLLAFTATVVVDARFDQNSFITQVLPKGTDDTNYYVKSTATACCDNCYCTKSIPPQCHCSDIGETCHSACKTCICTRSFPPQCRCTDVTNFCYKPCT